MHGALEMARIACVILLVDPGQAGVGFRQLEAGADAIPKVALGGLLTLAFRQGRQG